MIEVKLETIILDLSALIEKILLNKMIFILCHHPEIALVSLLFNRNGIYEKSETLLIHMFEDRNNKDREFIFA